jgi:alkylhydroperoxidase family enzyme
VRLAVILHVTPDERPAGRVRLSEAAGSVNCESFRFPLAVDFEETKSSLDFAQVERGSGLWDFFSSSGRYPVRHAPTQERATSA